MPSLEIHGIYEVSAPAPCHLVEITIRGSETELDLRQVVFQTKVGGRLTRQVPFAEHFLSPDGETILGKFTYAWHHENAWRGDVRLVFLMHYLQTGGILETPYGPPPSPRPQRLAALKYVSPY